MNTRERVNQQVRLGLIRLGYRAGQRTQRRLQTLHNYVDLGLWAQSLTSRLPENRGTRFELFDEALRHVRGATPLYLEFGVYEGKSLKWWCEELTTPGARFVGFDSFEGLPEDWNLFCSQGDFAVDVPQIGDPRASLEIGWFDDTLPTFKLPDHDQLIVNIDSDLYSSAVLVLKSLEEALVPGSLLYFDELSDRDHELRALREFLARTGKQVKVLGMSSGGVQWLFEVE